MWSSLSFSLARSLCWSDPRLSIPFHPFLFDEAAAAAAAADDDNNNSIALDYAEAGQVLRPMRNKDTLWDSTHSSVILITSTLLHRLNYILLSSSLMKRQLQIRFHQTLNFCSPLFFFFLIFFNRRLDWCQREYKKSCLNRMKRGNPNCSLSSSSSRRSQQQHQLST